jgi:N-carbamoyl-L-amino-acid hydrolase
MSSIRFLSFLLLAAATATAQTSPVRVQGERINAHLQALAQFGKNPQGGVSRVAYSDADVAGRAYVLGLMREAGLSVHVDAAGNLVGRREGTEPGLQPVVIGSHIDSVPEGGNYDGDVGSLAAIEVAQMLKERGVALRHPLEVIVFSNEEGVMLGSTALTHGIDEARLNLVSQSGKTVRDGVQLIGGDVLKLPTVQRPPGSVAAYLELHIEQGAVLEQSARQIGVVEGIVGIIDCEVTVQGFANHAGTTPMNQRHDALLAAARFIEAVNRIVTAIPGRQVGTVGWVRAEPGAYNVVPGKVVLGLEIRDLEADKIKALYAEVVKEAEVIGRQSGTTFQFEPHAMSEPALTDTHLQAVIAQSAQALQLSTQRLPSGAGHDAQEMAALGPIGMIFIPSVGGISHSPKEYSRPGDIENGANVLLESLRRVDAEAPSP